MQNLADCVKELNTLIKEYRFEDALSKFYDETVVSAENESPPAIGLAAYKEAAKTYIENVSNYSADLKNVIISDGISVSEWHYKFDHKQWGHWDRVQVSVQRWKNGKIVHERHHYTGS